MESMLHSRYIISQADDISISGVSNEETANRWI